MIGANDSARRRGAWPALAVGICIITPGPTPGSLPILPESGMAPRIAIAIDSVAAARPDNRTYLEPNIPNPFSGSTTIAYSLAEETPVMLTIHDAFYNPVVTLVDQTQPAGRYTIIFRPTDISSGVYFYTLRTNRGIDWGRMVMVE